MIVPSPISAARKDLQCATALGTCVQQRESARCKRGTWCMRTASIASSHGPAGAVVPNLTDGSAGRKFAVCMAFLPDALLNPILSESQKKAEGAGQRGLPAAAIRSALPTSR